VFVFIGNIVMSIITSMFWYRNCHCVSGYVLLLWLKWSSLRPM